MTSVGTAVGTLLALFLGDVDQIGEALGVIVVGMSILFLVVARRPPPPFPAPA